MPCASTGALTRLKWELISKAPGKQRSGQSDQRYNRAANCKRDKHGIKVQAVTRKVDNCAFALYSVMCICQYEVRNMNAGEKIEELLKS